MGLVDLRDGCKDPLTPCSARPLVTGWPSIRSRHAFRQRRFSACLQCSEIETRDDKVKAGRPPWRGQARGARVWERPRRATPSDRRGARVRTSSRPEGSLGVAGENAACFGGLVCSRVGPHAHRPSGPPKAHAALVQIGARGQCRGEHVPPRRCGDSGEPWPGASKK